MNGPVLLAGVVLIGAGIWAFSKSSPAAPELPGGGSGPAPGGGTGPAQGTPGALDIALTAGDCDAALNAVNAIYDAGDEPSAAQMQALFSKCGHQILQSGLDGKVDCETLKYYLAQLVAAGVEPSDAEWAAYTDRGCDLPEPVQDLQAKEEAKNLYAQAANYFSQAAGLYAQADHITANLANGAYPDPADEADAKARIANLTQTADSLMDTGNGLKHQADALLSNG